MLIRVWFGYVVYQMPGENRRVDDHRGYIFITAGDQETASQVADAAYRGWMNGPHGRTPRQGNLWVRGPDSTMKATGKLLENPAALQRHVRLVLQTNHNAHPVWSGEIGSGNGLSVVLFLLSASRCSPGCSPEPCLILNKRSVRVPQPGDLCCPGGGIEPRFDRFAAHLLRLPLSPLRQWPHYRTWQAETPRRAARLRLLMAAALREGVEEMRLNPLGVRFLGGLPPEHLVMFKRTIVPLVAWVARQQHFRPNWEVERIVRIPLRTLLVPDGYMALHLRMEGGNAEGRETKASEFPAFRFRSLNGTEVLWGATYRITMNFMEQVFGFQPPEHANGTAIEKRLTAEYLTGKG